MSSKKRKIVLIVSIISVLSVLFVTIAATALSKGGISDLWNNAANKDGVVKYEKPSVGDIAQDGAYPDEVKSNVSANAQEKKWYEYITYSKKALDEIQIGNEKVVFYDPYDYSYGMIMTISNPEEEYGDYYDGAEFYTTANEISVSYSASKSHSWSSDVSLNFGFEEETKFSAIISDVKIRFSQDVGFSHTQSGSNDSSSSKTITYNALYFNDNGTPYNWRIVKYTVYLPLFCEIKTLVNNEWVVTGTTYCILTTIQGTCREWIDEVAYIEDWRTGEKVQVEKFWGEFFKNEQDLINAYRYNPIPVD